MLRKAFVVMLIAFWINGAVVEPVNASKLELYGRLPGVEHIALSPSGKRFAFVASHEKSRKVGIATVDGKPLGILPIEDDKIRGLQWVNDRRLLIYKTATFKSVDFRFAHELMAIINYDIETRSITAVFENRREIGNAVFGDYGVFALDDQPYGFYGGITFGKTKSSYYFQDGYPELYRVNLDTGATRKIDDGAKSMDGWAVDATGKIIAHARYNDEDGRWRLYAGKTREKLLFEITTRFGIASIVGLGRTPETVLIYYRSNGRGVFEEVSLSDASREELFDEYNASDALYDPVSGLLIGARTMNKDRAVFFNPRLQARYIGMRKAFPGYEVELLSYTPDLGRMICKTDGKDDAGTYWFVDIATGNATPIGSDYPQIPKSGVASTELIQYKAQDGLQIEAVLTLPNGREAKQLPLVVMPHGGPIGIRDTLGFDFWAQAFASQGYAVLQPNYRGSSGYGRKFREAGFGEFGRKMISDIAEGVTTLSKSGVVDSERVCIVGASYGGYAALAGVTLQQGIYRCAVSVNGVFDLADFMNYRGRYARSGDSVLRYWKAAIGEGENSELNRKNISPSRFADQVDVPVLLIHGEDDTVVPIAQSKAMYKRLKRAKKNVKFKKLDGDDHWFSVMKTRIDIIESSVNFVKRHNAP